jgi:hypothetical protein
MDERLSKLRRLMAKMPETHRTRWCIPDELGCGCMGCANNSHGLANLGYTIEEWQDALKNPIYVPEISNEIQLILDSLQEGNDNQACASE